MVALIVLCVIFAATCCILGIICNKIKKSSTRKELDSNFELKEIRKEVVQLNSQINNLKSEKASLEEKYNNVFKEYSEAVSRIDELRQKQIDNSDINAVQQQLAQLISIKEVKEKELEELNNYSNNVLSNLNEKQDLLKQLEQSIDAIKETSNKTMQELQEDERRQRSLLAQLNDFLDAAKSSYRAVILAQNDEIERGEYRLDGKETHLVSILRELRDNYSELDRELAKIEGEKIGRSKVQDVVRKNGLDGKCGIYRLVLKEDENICYVGQAKDIKERGFTHCKKMVGMESKGGEKLYDYNIDDFGGTVVEECDVSQLNEREHYGIEYYGCVEIGLNKKN